MTKLDFFFITTLITFKNAFGSLWKTLIFINLSGEKSFKSMQYSIRDT